MRNGENFRVKWRTLGRVWFSYPMGYVDATLVEQQIRRRRGPTIAAGDETVGIFVESARTGAMVAAGELVEVDFGGGGCCSFVLPMFDVSAAVALAAQVDAQRADLVERRAIAQARRRAILTWRAKAAAAISAAASVLKLVIG